MNKHLWRLSTGLALSFLFTSCIKSPHCNCDNTNATATVKVFATGLNNPRGLRFAGDGNLFVAEGGTGGTNSTIGQCDQVPPPVGPYTGSIVGARISKINGNGVRTTYVDNFPSTQSSLGEVSGVSDVEFIGNKMYALITAGGCSHGVPSIPNELVKINANKTWTPLANLSSFLQAHPAAQPNPGDFEPDGDWYSMVNAGDNLYAIEANHGELDKINPSNGHVSRVVDFSADFGHIVPTAVVYHRGNFFVGNLNPFPIVAGSSSVYRVTTDGDVSVIATGFNTILGLAFDDNDNLYVLENTVGSPFPAPNAGRITRVNLSGEKATVATGLNLPTAMTYGPDGRLYVSNVGFGPAALGGGQILQLTLKKCDCDKGGYNY